MFKTTKAHDVKVGDVQMISSQEKTKIIYYYYRATSVFVGDKVDAIHDPFTDAFVANRTVNCVEIVWLPLSYAGKTHITRYHNSATLDIAVDVIDVNDLVQEEDVND